MDIRKIKKLIELIDESGIAEIEIKEGEQSVRISRYAPGASAVAVPAPPITAVSAIPAAMASTSTPAPATAAPGAEPAAPDGHVVHSPLVGIFYRAPSPGAAPFIEEGAQVKAGQTLCIIEAMKMMNQVEADRPGILTRILVENGAAVEYDEPLFVIR